MENVIQSKVIGRDFRITSTPSGLWIEVLDGDIEPIRLTRDQLAEFGLSYRETAHFGSTSGRIAPDEPVSKEA